LNHPGSISGRRKKTNQFRFRNHSQFIHSRAPKDGPSVLDERSVIIRSPRYIYRAIDEHEEGHQMYSISCDAAGLEASTCQSTAAVTQNYSHLWMATAIPSALGTNWQVNITMHLDNVFANKCFCKIKLPKLHDI
jgi:hypothetical protein